MKTYISAWPVYPDKQRKLGIYDSGYVKSVSIGRVLHSLIKDGHTELNAFVECYDQDDGKNINRLVIHCSKPKGIFHE